MATSVIKGDIKIVEEGTNGNWRYRKWSNGMIEAWGSQWYSSIDMTITAPTYGGYRSDTITLDIPSGIFDETPNFVFLQKRGAQAGAIYFANALSATSVQFMLGGASTSSRASNQTILAYAVQI